MNIEDYIHFNRYTQEEFAKLVGISLKTLNRIIEGYDLKLSTAAKIVDETNGEVSFEDLREHYENSSGG